MLMKGVARKDAEVRIDGIIRAFDAGKRADVRLAAASISAGAVMCTPSETYAKVFNKADKALYHVKQNGKDGYSFYSADSEFEVGEKLDADKLVSGIRNNGSYDGALDVDYRQFTKLYEYIGNLEKRFSHPYKLVLIELAAVEADAAQAEAVEKAMYYMDQSIRQTIRNVDVFTRFNRRQYLVILVGTDAEGVKTVVDRIFRGYYKMSGSGAFSPLYTVIP